MARLDGKVAIVTGAAGGMGRAIASALAADGATVVLVDIADEALEHAAGSLRAAGGTVHAMSADVTSRHDVAGLVDGVVERFGRLDVLVNNAGIVTVAPLETYPEEDFDRVMAVNLKGAFLVSQAAGRAMLAAGGGAIVNVASIAGHVPSPGSVAYSASKAGLLMLTRQIAVEWGHRGIRCNSVAPGAMSWSMDVIDRPPRPSTPPVTSSRWAASRTPMRSVRSSRSWPRTTHGTSVPRRSVSTAAFASPPAADSAA